MEKIAVGIVGAGFMGDMHARAIAETPHAEVRAVADPDLDRARQIAERYGGGAYASHQEMLEVEELRAVVVCTPETHHRAPCVDAAARGCAVFVEKPIAATLEDADAIIDACRRHGMPLMVGYILRFEPAYVRIKQACDAGTIGRFLSGYARRNAPILEGRRLGGRTSVINYLTVHDADQLLWYNPSPVVKVTAKEIRGRLHGELGVADFTWTLMEFSDGGLGVVESGWGLTERWASWSLPESWGGFGDVEMNVIGTDGVLSLDFTPMNLASVDAAEGWKFPDTRHWPVINGRIGGALRMEMNHFLECVAAGAQPLIDGVEARRSLEVAIVAERSIAEGREVALPLS